MFDHMLGTSKPPKFLTIIQRKVVRLVKSVGPVWLDLLQNLTRCMSETVKRAWWLDQSKWREEEEKKGKAH